MAPKIPVKSEDVSFLQNKDLIIQMSFYISFLSLLFQRTSPPRHTDSKIHAIGWIKKKKVPRILEEKPWLYGHIGYMDIVTQKFLSKQKF